MKYSIDTSAILDCWNRYYPPDVFPVVWTRLDQLIDQGILIATEEVLVELERKSDEVYKWALKHKNMFISTNQDIQLAVRSVLRDHKKLIDERKNRSGADPFVVALAQIEACPVITGERASNSSKRPHIPDVCHALGIKCLDMLQFFREQGWSFR